MSVETLAEQLGIVPAHRRLLRRLLEILAEEGVLASAAEGGWKVVRTPEAVEPDSVEALSNGYRHGAAEAGMLRRCGVALASVLRGEIDPVELLFPGGSAEDVERLYAGSPGSRVGNTLVAEAVREAIAALPAGRKVRVLEVGAGSGATISFLLPLLPPDQTDYLFTDVSPLLTARAAERFTPFPFLRTQVLDLERSPAEQGLASERFDLIVAANVLHATADLRDSLANLRELLSPDGLLVLVEGTGRQRWLDLIFGLTEGWWRFHDTDLRPDYPLLPEGAWLQLLAESGFREAASLGTGAASEAGIHLAQSVLVARGPAENVQLGRWLLFADEGGTAAALAARLAECGGQSTLVYAGNRYEECGVGRLRIDPASSDQYAQALRTATENGAIPLEGILHLWSLNLTTDDGTTPPLERAERLGCESVLHLVQATARAGWRDAPRLWLVTRGAQAAGVAGPPIEVAQSSLWGFARTLVHEQPELRTARIDLPHKPTADEVDALFTEIRADGEEDQVALRAEGRYVARLARWSPEAPPEREAPVFANAGERSFSLEVSPPGTLDALLLREILRRSPGPREVEIEIEAAGLNFLDVLASLGVIPAMEPDGEPGVLHPGLECAGRVTVVGAGVTEYAPGDRVLAVGYGCFGTHVTAPVELVVPRSEALEPEAGATIPVAFGTAYQALVHTARLQAGERVLIHAAAGGVGLAAVQIAQHLGAEIHATAGSEAKREYLRSLGVQYVYDSRNLAFADEVRAATGGEGVDVVLNSLAGEFLTRSFGLLRDFGRFIEIGKRDYFADNKLGLQPFLRNLSFSLVDLLGLARQRPAQVASLLREVLELFANGVLRPLPREVFPIARVAEAFHHMAAARHTGKIVISLQDREATRIAPARPALAARSGWAGEIRADGAYLIPGGMGGVGLSVAEWLVRQGAGAVVLVGRSQPSAETEAAIDQLRGRGTEITVAQADITHDEEVSRLFAQIADGTFPLRGIFHAAAILDDGIVLQLTPERLGRVLAPKVAGAWNLHVHSVGLPLDFFVFFSSGASLLGSPGQANYAAGNAFEDALAHHRRALGLPAQTINWGPWTEVGLAAAEANRGERLGERGIAGLTPEQGLNALERLLRRPDATQTGVMALNLRQWRQFYPRAAEAPLLESLEETGSGSVGAGSGDAGGFRKELFATLPEQRRPQMEAHLTGHISRVLRIDTVQLERTTPLGSLGFDSLLALELRNRLEASLGLSLPATLIWSHRDIAALARHLVERLGSDTPEASSEVTLPQATASDGALPSAENGNGHALPSDLAAVAALTSDEALRALEDELSQIPAEFLVDE